MAKETVVITEPEFRKAEPVFTSYSRKRCVSSAPEEEELARAIRSEGARHAIVGVLPYRGSLYAALPRGAVLARFGVGHDGIDKGKATEAGLLCTNTPGVLDDSVAELTMCLTLAAARKVVPLATSMRAGSWAQLPGCELREKTLAVIGVGPIGRTVARIAAFGFGMRVVGCTRSAPLPEDVVRQNGFASVVKDFGEAVREADFVSLHIPAIAENARFLNHQRLSRMRDSAWVINTARGAVVDEAALYDALESRQIAGAALDVFEREPYAPADAARDLRKLDNVILVPHVGSNTPEANHRMARKALENIELAEAGEFDKMDMLNRGVLAAR